MLECALVWVLVDREAQKASAAMSRVGKLECRGPLRVFGQSRRVLIMICERFGEGRSGESPLAWRAMGCGALGLQRRVAVEPHAGRAVGSPAA